MSQTANADPSRFVTVKGSLACRWLDPKRKVSGDLLEHIEPADHGPGRIRLPRSRTRARDGIFRRLSRRSCSVTVAAVLGEPDRDLVRGHVQDMHGVGSAISRRL